MIHYSDSFLEFIREGRNRSGVLAALLKYYDRCYNYGEPNQLSDYFTTTDIDFLTFRNNGKISYLPSGKQHIVNSDGTWAKTNRQEGTPTRVIRKLFTARGLVNFGLSDKDFEDFTNMYKARFSDEGYEFKVLPNTEIPDVYCANRMEGDAGLNQSCMNGDWEYLEIYKNCKQLEIIALWKDGYLAGRALLWSLEDGIKLMDRVYVACDFLYETFVDYANKNGFWHKEWYKTYQYPANFIKPDGTKINKIFRINTPTEFNRYPYIDTFRYGFEGMLTNSNCGFYYTNTDGNRGSYTI